MTVQPMIYSMSVGPDAGAVAAPRPGPQPFSGLTREDGSYELVVHDAGEAWSVVESADGKVQYASRTVQIPDAESYALDFMLGGAPVSGIVVDKETSEPVGGADVRLAAKKGDDGAGASAGSDGRFALEVPPGDYAAISSAEGYARSSADLSVGAAGLSDVRLELTRGAVLQGRVLDGAGRGAPGLLVMARSVDDPAVLPRARTMDDGSFRFDRLPPRPVNLATGSAATGFAVRAGVMPGDENVLLRLRPGGRLRVQVVDARGTPVAKAWVRVVGVDGVKTLVPARADETDATGATEMSCPAGLLTLEATREARRGEAAVEVAAGAIAVVRVVLVEGPPAR